MSNLEELVLEILDRHRRGEIKIVADVIVDIKIHVNGPATPFTVNPSGVPSTATQGQPYSGQLKASGGTPPYNFVVSSGSLPDGLVLGASDGSITGTPTAAGDFDAEIDASDSAGASASVKLAGKTA